MSTLNTSEVSTNELVFNQALSDLHPPMKIWGYQDGGGDPVLDRVIDIGDGSDGLFNNTTYANFSENGDVSGQIIRLNTDVQSEYQFTQFTLDAGWTIRPSGSQPLVIKVQSTILVNGVIDCSGDDGEDLDPVLDTVATAGGIGRCGGSDGGDGGTSTVVGQDGLPNLSAVTGGGGGSVLDAGDGGAGGGAFDSSGIGADNGVGAGGGTAGNVVADDTFLILGGGAGGGGGSDGNDGSSGAAGGAGGGVIIIYALENISLSATGAIRANGGNGGGQTVSRTGGGGGGGGGGSILMVSAGSIILDGPVTATAGAAGDTDGSDGGQGADGRTWVTDVNGVAGGGVVESPVALLVSYGNVSYDTGSFVFQTTELDFLNTQPLLVAASATGTNISSSTVAMELSTNEAAGSTPSFQDATGLVGQRLGRFVTFKATITSATNTDPVRVESFSIDVDDFQREEFDLESACGSLKGPDSPSGGPWMWLINFMFIILLSIYRFRLSKFKV